MIKESVVGSDVPRNQRIFMLGATGSIGRATVKCLVDCGHRVVCFVRPEHVGSLPDELRRDGVEVRFGMATNPQSLAAAGFRGERFDCLVSCMASRTGVPEDAWTVDFQAHDFALSQAKEIGVRHFILLSAVCVQRPLLAFQEAKLAFERKLIQSGLRYSIIRPTAFFKSLSGQVDRVTRGKPYLLFGDGRQTACKPISDRDLAVFIEGCIADSRYHNRILPVGGAGPAITPRDIGEYLFHLTGQKPRFRNVPIGLLDVAAGVFDMLGRIVPASRTKAELARIGRYYGTESMLVLDPETGQYDAAATPSVGRDTLFDYLRQRVAGTVADDRADHTVF